LLLTVFRPFERTGLCNDKASGLCCLVERDGGRVDVVPGARADGTLIALACPLATTSGRS
jgi:hypothetical protein